ncbi:Asp-tRNA(Asn)/Glu-tRNA(Gln) amidotransferase subunit GatC [Deinococcus aluminii]|uniref:Aspartyl/glutamyl-tRNA(Asn/Gln) amidotransferase subunit C n=1 Tax=Deinococcus aluminii TaxID=1656885 RepID=A0ABP9XBL2_9DEIO
MIDAAQVEHLARLARLELTPEERGAMQTDLNSILGYFEQLRAVDTEGVEEMQRPEDLVNVLREDVPGAVFSPEVVAALAPEMQEGFVRVPRTVEAE